MPIKKRPYSTPEGYFAGLEDRLSGIPSVESTGGLWPKLTPYLALVACFGLAYVLGVNLIKKPVAPDDQAFYEQLYISDMVPRTVPFYSGEIELPEIADDSNIVDYLIDSGVSVDLIDYVLY